MGENRLPTIDVVIPNFNYGRYLSLCANSVLGQTGVNVRLLIIDNASTDNSVEVAKGLAAGDSRVELLLRRKNLGPHASFNEGIDWAASDYFLILCSDDLLAGGALGRGVVAVWVSLFRNTPLLVQLLFWYFAAWNLLPQGFPGRNLLNLHAAMRLTR